MGAGGPAILLPAREAVDDGRTGRRDAGGAACRESLLCGILGSQAQFLEDPEKLKQLVPKINLNGEGVLPTKPKKGGDRPEQGTEIGQSRNRARIGENLRQIVGPAPERLLPGGIQHLDDRALKLPKRAGQVLKKMTKDFPWSKAVGPG